MEIGAQLYTVRDYCKTLEDFAETLKKVADIGYKNVQVSGVCEFTPEWLKAELDKNDLKCVLTHVRPPETFYEDTQTVIANHKVFDCKYLGLGSFGFDKEATEPRYPLFVEKYKAVTKALKEAGQYFMYHNHHQEFYKLDGKNILERMAEDFSADELGFTLDTCWVQTGGADPAQWLEIFKGRTPCIHVKDRDHVGNFLPVGEGNLNTNRILTTAVNCGVEYALVEQDECYGQDPFDCLARSYKCLTSFGLK